MKTVKVVKISIKDPRLRNIRRNLRTVIKLAAKAEEERLDKLEDLYHEKYMSQGLAPSQNKRDTYLIQARDKLGYALAESICGRGDCDVVWIPWYKCWDTVEKYEHDYKDADYDEFFEFLNYDNFSGVDFEKKFGYSFKHRPK